jgi:hypothetical protein
MACAVPPEHVEIEMATPADRQARLAAFFGSLEREDGPLCYAYPTFLCYLTRACTTYGDEFNSMFARMARRLVSLASGPVYLADGAAFIPEALHGEFPELALFELELADAFVESLAHPNVYIETRRFADLRSLSRLRRELKRTQLTLSRDGLDIVKTLLGLA